MSVPSTQVFFPVLPNFMSWSEWSGNFAIYYGREPLPDVPEDRWQEAANEIALLPTFAAYPIPGPETYPTWQDWAMEVTTIINGPSR
jgi:hypothetical protein